MTGTRLGAVNEAAAVQGASEGRSLYSWPTGAFVVSVEGIDGAGKSTLVSGLAESLRATLPTCTVLPMFELSSPLGTPLRHHLHSLPPIARAYAFAAERHWMVAEVAEAQPCIAIWDRYVDSSIASRIADARQRPDDDASRLMQVAGEIGAHLPKPHLTLLLDIDVETAVDRIGRRERTHPNVYDAAGLVALQDGFDQCVRHDPGRFARVDATASADAVRRTALASLLRELRVADHPHPIPQLRED